MGIIQKFLNNINKDNIVDNLIDIKLKYQPILVISGILIIMYLLSEFPILEFTMPFTKELISFYIVPLSLQLILKFIMAVVMFFGLLILIFVIHINLFRLMINVGKLIMNIVDAVINILDDL